MLAITCGGLIGGLTAFALVTSDTPYTASFNNKNTQPAAVSDTGLVTASYSKDTLPPTPGSKPTDLGSSTPDQDSTKTVSVGKGDTLMKVLTRAGADPQESHEAITAL